jgi:hypothetical protein
MLERYLPLGPDGLTYAWLEKLATQRLPESEILELKRERPRDSFKFARRIAAMANNRGGLLMIGMPDEKNPDRSLNPVRLDREEMTVQQIINTRIEPSIVPRYHRVLKDAADPIMGILAVEVPSPPRLPLAVSDTEHTFFEIRSGTEPRPLREREIERMYRERFTRLGDVDERFRRLVAYGFETAELDGFMHAYVAIIPLFPVERLFRLTARELTAVTQLFDPVQQEQGFQRFPHLAHQAHLLISILGRGDVGRIVPSVARPGFKRMEFTYSWWEVERLRESGWMEFHDDGTLYMAIPAMRDAVPIEDGTRDGWLELDIVSDVVRGLAAYSVLAGAYKIDGEIAIQVGIPRQGNLWLGPAARFPGRRFRLRGLSQPVATTISTEIEDLTIGPKLLRTAKLVLDDLFSAFGWHECDLITVDGTLARAAFRERDWPWIEQWAKQIGAVPTQQEI